MTVMKKPRIVVFGGGTGSYIVLSGLRAYPVELTAIVAMTDSGGSTGRLRDQYGVLPPGDLRQALVALSDSSELWRNIFAYRFDKGDFQGHNFGNIFISVLERVTGSIEGAIVHASQILNVKGNVLPVTYSNCTLCAEFEDGSVIMGENLIDDSLTKRPRITKLYLTPEAEPNSKVIEVIKTADFIIFSPGDLYTSLLPNFLVREVSHALSESVATKIYISNIMTKRGQTDGFTVADHVYEVERYSGCFLDYIVVNDTVLSQEIRTWYQKFGNVLPVVNDLDEKHVTEARIIQADIIDEVTYGQDPADKVKRSLVRHSPQKLARVLMSIIYA